MNANSFTISTLADGGTRRTAEQMFPLIDEQIENGQTQKQFCRERGLAQHVFSYWKRKYQEEKAAQSGFVALGFGASEQSAPIRLPLGAGRTLEISANLPPSYLAELIRQLG